MLYENKEEKEKVLLVGVNTGRREIAMESSMNELKELATAADAEVMASVVQNRESIDNATYVGKGKAEEIRNAAEELDVDTVIFNNELTGSQIRNLEQIMDRKILDRTSLILDIFANRSTSKEGKLQVELAQLKYRLPRLVGFRNHLSRQGAGIGTRGPGEQKLEVDRRHVLKRIHDIEGQLDDLTKTRSTKRKKRMESQIPIIAIVGYTNAGKSTLLNKIMEGHEEFEEHKKVYEKDMLFATLETSFRKSRFPSGKEFIMIDTVGFVSELPTKLVEAFKGTLEEINYADLILHVLDITNEDIEIQNKTTMGILKDLEVLDKPMITVLNKVDKKEDYELEYVLSEPKIMVSAKTGYNIDELLKLIESALPQKHKKFKMVVPYDKSGIISGLFEDKLVLGSEYQEDGIHVEAMLDEELEGRLKQYIVS